MSHEDDPRWDRAFDAWNSGDREGAIFLYKSLATDGAYAAYARLGEAYESGGETQNFNEALRWYRKSYYEHSDLSGAVGLARMYFYGKGIEKDYSHAFNIYSDIKLSHNAVVYLMLGRIYNYGYLGRNDLKKAKINYLKSIAKGNIPAIRNLAFLEKNNGNYFLFIKLMIIGIYTAFKIAYQNPKDVRFRDK